MAQAGSIHKLYKHKICNKLNITSTVHFDELYVHAIITTSHDNRGTSTHLAHQRLQRARLPQLNIPK
jgi:hypothetical protein